MSGSEREGLTRTRSLFYNNRALDLEKVKSDLDAGFNDDADDDIEDASDLDDILASGKGSRGSKSKQRNRDTASSKKRNSSSEDLDPSLPAAPARKRSKLNGHPNDDLVDIEIEHDDDDVTVLNTSTKSKPREPAAATTASYLDFLTEKDLAMANSAARHGYGGGNLAGSAEALGTLAAYRNDLQRSLSNLAMIGSSSSSGYGGINLADDDRGAAQSTGESRDVKVIITFPGTQKQDVRIRIYKSDPLSKVLTVASNLLQPKAGETVYLKLGRLPLDAAQSAADYGIMEDERIEVHTRAAPAPKPATINVEEDADERKFREQIEKEVEQSAAAAEGDTVTLSIRSPGEDEAKSVRIRRTDPLGKVIKAFAGKLAVDPSKLKLMFDGERIDPERTPDNLELEDDDLLDLVRVA